MPIHNPLHPGEIIREILVEGAGLTVSDAADKLKVDRTTLSRLINGHAGISAKMAYRLSKLLPKTNVIMWLNLQRDYDAWMVNQKYSHDNLKIHQ